jgi:hypothetical protein
MDKNIEKNEANLVSSSSGPEVSERKEKIAQLRESVSKKIRYISEVRNQIASPEITVMNITEFRAWAENQKENIFAIFPEQRIIIERIIFLNSECARLGIEVRGLDDKKDNIVNTAVERHLKNSPDKLDQYFNEELTPPEHINLENAALTAEEHKEVDAITEQECILSNQEYDYLTERKSLFKDDDTLFVSTASNFFTEIAKKREEVLTIKDMFERDSTKDLIKYGQGLRDFVSSKGKDIDIMFDTYDVIIYISREEALKYFIGNEKYNGFHLSGTPFSFVITEERSEEDIAYTETHEMGHNISECLESAGIHNTEYYGQVIQQLEHEVKRYMSLKSLTKVPKLILEDSQRTIIKRIRSQIWGLNGEISADAENLLEGKFSSFYFHFLNTVESLNNFVRKSVLINGNKEFAILLKKEINDLTTKAAEHVKKALFLSMIARKYHKEDGFFAAILMSPQSMRLVERYLKDELGDEFEFEKSFSAFVPESVLPEKLHCRIYEIDVDFSSRLLFTSSSNHATRRIIPPKNYVGKKVEATAPGKHRIFSNFDYKFAELFERSSIFEPIELKRFVAFATPERINSLSEDEKFQAAQTLRYAVADDTSRNQIFDLEKLGEIREYAQNIKKLFDIFGEQEEGRAFLGGMFDTYFYEAFKISLAVDNPETLERFVESWDGMEFKLEKYISDTGNNYDESWDIREILDDLKADDKVGDKVINDPQSTRVFQYIKSIS